MKEKTISIRVTEEEFEILRVFAEQFGVCRSELIRDAFKFYANTFLQSGDYTGSKAVVNKELLRKLFDNASDELVRNLSNESFNNSLKDDVIDSHYEKKSPLETDEQKFRYHMRMLVKYVLSDNGQNWFDKISYRSIQDTVILSGHHEIGLNFSRFILYFLLKYAEKYNYSVLARKINEGYLFVKFEKN